MHELLRRPSQRSGAPVLIGVVHLLATPGAPGFAGSCEELLARAERDALALRDGGVDGVIVENFGDAPFLKECVPAETVATLSVAVARVRSALGELPVGVNVLRNDARSALGICVATGASFLRVNVHTGAMVTDQGLVEGRAAETLRERARLAPEITLLADVHVKHATPLGRETLPDAAEEAWTRGRADVLLVSGSRTGKAPPVTDLARVRERVPDAPLWIGSGLTEGNAGELLEFACGAIVGTWLKRGGAIGEQVDPARVARLRRACDAGGQ